MKDINYKTKYESLRPSVEYWLNEFNEYIPSSDLLDDHKQPKVEENESGQHNFRIGSDTLLHLKEIALNNDASLYMVMLSLFNILLYKLSRQKDIDVDITSSKKSDLQLDGAVDVFDNKNTIRTHIDSNDTFPDYLCRVKDKVIEVFKHQNCKFDDYGNRINFSVEHFDLVLTALEAEGSLDFQINYAAALFNQRTIEEFGDYMIQLIDNVIKDRHAEIHSLRILPLEEVKRLVYDCNNTNSGYCKEVSIAELIDQVIRQCPDNEAIIFGNERITYGKLGLQADILSKRILNVGAKEEDVVAIRMERSIEMLVSIVAVLKAGCAYLPIDPAYPEKRIDYMLRDSQANILLTLNLFDHEINLEHIDGVNREIELSKMDNGSKLAYIIYTSGSTGVPKGVRIQNRSVVNFAHAMNLSLDLTAYKNVLCITTISFDIFILETIVPFINGMRVVLTKDKEDMDGERIASYIVKYDIDLMQTTPSRWSILMGSNEFFHAAKKLKIVLSGGEALNVGLARDFHKLSGPKIFNMYGPTETTVWSLVQEIHEPEKIYIGKPIANTRVYVLDEDMQPVPRNVVGELYIGGDGLARDYYRRHDLTDERFQTDPFHANQKIYKTGDLVKRKDDDLIQFIGRADSQIKLRGYRIELGEIEETLLRTDGLSKAKIILKDSGNNQFLCAFMEWDGQAVEISEIRKKMLEYLPDYMIPSRFITLKSFPLTDNGKVDIQKLKKYPITFSGKVVRPTNKTEKYLLSEISKVLGTDEISITDNLYEAGANSLSIMRIVQRIQTKYEIQFTDIVMHPYINELAQLVKPKDSSLLDEYISSGILYYSKAGAGNNAIDESMNESRNKYLTRIDNEVKTIDLKKRKNYRHVFLTGATGYLGCHILKQLIENTNYIITVLVRGLNGSSQKRIADAYSFYFLEDLLKHTDRIRIIEGDFTQPGLALDDREYALLANRIDCIIHAGADVRHFGLYEDIFKSNVVSVQNLLALCEVGKDKDLVHISTTSIGSGEIKGRDSLLFTEYDLNVGQSVSNNYVLSKLEAEKVVVEARKNGQNATIIRVGNLVFQSDTGRCQRNINENAFYNRIKVMMNYGKIPESEARELEFTFVDAAAEAIRILFDKAELVNNIYHVFNSQLVSYSELAKLIKSSGFQIETIEPDNLLKEISDNTENPEAQELLDIIIGKLSSLPGTDITVSGERTEKILEQYGFLWERLTDEHIRRMLLYGQKIKLFKKI